MVIIVLVELSCMYVDLLMYDFWDTVMIYGLVWRCYGINEDVCTHCIVIDRINLLKLPH